MSKELIRLLRVDDRRFRSYVDRLERLTMHPSIDIKLALEIRFAVSEKIKLLGLDPNTVSSEELFEALKNKLIDDESALYKQFKMEKNSDYLRAHKIAILATKLSKKDKALSLTTAGCKRVLLAVPPKRTLRLLKLRSLESVLKREDPRVVYALATIIEDDSWRAQMHAKSRRLQTKDFSWQSPEAATLPKGWYEKLHGALSGHGLILGSPEIGFAIILPLLKKEIAGSLTYGLCSLLQILNDYAAESMAYLNESLTNGYHDAFSKIAHRMTVPLDPVHGMSPSWTVLYEHVARGLYDGEFAEADFILADLEWQSLEMKLASLVPHYAFWCGTHYLGFENKESTVSLHIMDVARNILVPVSHKRLSTTHLENSLWNELNMRYMSQESIAKKVLSQLRVEDSFVL